MSGGGGAIKEPASGQQAGGTHPVGMLSCITHTCNVFKNNDAGPKFTLLQVSLRTKCVLHLPSVSVRFSHIFPVHATTNEKSISCMNQN